MGALEVLNWNMGHGWRLYPGMRFLLKGLGALLAPPLCLGCRAQVLSDNEALWCATCATELEKGTLGGEVEPVGDFPQHQVMRLPAWWRYQKGKTAALLIHHLKYHGYERLGERLGYQYGLWLKQQLPESAFAYDAVVPVPLHGLRYAWRGFNQSAAIGRGMAHALNKPLWPRALSRTRFTKPQLGKNYPDRKRANLHIHPRQFKRLRGACVLLVDDVSTTGSTLTAATHALLKGNVSKVGWATLAAT